VRDAWQQQQHLDLVHAANGNSSSPQEAWMPQLLKAMLNHAMSDEVQDSAAVLRSLRALAAQGRAFAKWQQQRLRSADGILAAAGSGGDEDSARAVVEGAAASYMLGCLSDAACRASLACWVLTWHSCMLQQGGDYGSVQSTCVSSVRRGLGRNYGSMASRRVSTRSLRWDRGVVS
jgi:hypothetical protein